MTTPSLPDQVIALDRALDGAAIPHGFGGALALAYCAEPRTTDDIDINICVPVDRAGDVIAALPEGVTRTGEEFRAIGRDGFTRLWWGRTAIDLFFPQHPFHDELARAITRQPFGDTTIPVIAGEHLVVCKAMFNRRKDWLDIEIVAEVGRTDLTASLRWLEDLLGRDAEQTVKLAEIIDRSP